MTEEEAKTKWCPFVRLGTMAGASLNRDAEHTDRETCIDAYGGRANKCVGSDCMAWRNTESIAPFKANISVKDHWEQHGYTVTATDEPETILVTPPETDAGFCGLAGRP